jgi:cytochrome c
MMRSWRSDRSASRVRRVLVRCLAGGALPCTLAAALLGAGGCDERLDRAGYVQAVPGGDADVGRAALRRYGCNDCHVIPGVRGADAWVGPPLIRWADRVYIAGLLPNTPDNLIAWIQDPQRIRPGSAMPTIGVSTEDARHIASYLYTLR